MVKAIKELKEAPNAKGDINYFYSNDYDEPLLEYVYILSEYLTPHTELEHHAGLFSPTSYSEFLTRYFADKIDKKDKNKFLRETNVIKTVELMGYDIEKFWYLILFIYDFSYGYCKKGVKIGTPRRKINELIDAMIDNIESFNGQYEVPNFEREMKLTLSVKGKEKLEINDQDAIFYLFLMCSKELKRTKKSHGLDSIKLTEIKKQKENLIESPQPIHIFYFTKIFQTFFDLKPPIKKRAPKGSGLNFSRIFIISRFCYMLGLTFDSRFTEDATQLNAILTYYKGQKIEKVNGIYATENSFLNFL
nr:hypothetical protein [uncultured Draconibacterium sp.]